ncbi:hypothetical protein N865_19660 [Intrasporangium oryzae NRRL B-24470]|uniref:Uncharacterized protein n=1 Tax=Intrasporangium oryzae NRRL B-24470 TaxID=1386089 RepID=W9G552_9MICO|nr:hypothetical protein [Intrasporangium oryzae]EWS99937.1 hypothetical protein N865_19660 [Intrasporangium oryzae NRRL B-24470]
MTTNVIAQMLAQDPRPVEQVVIDAIHNVDVVMRDHVAKIEEKDDVSVKDLGRLVNLSQVAHSLASSAVTQKLIAFRLHEAHADVVVTRLVFSAVLDALEDHLSPRGLGSQASAFRWWVVRIIQAALAESMVQGRDGLGYESEQPRRSPFTDAALAVPWPDELADLVISFSPPDRERARPLSLDASGGSAPGDPSVAPASSGPGPVMGRPGIPHVPADPHTFAPPRDPATLTEPDLPGADADAEPAPWDGQPIWLPPPDLGGLGRVTPEPALVGRVLDDDEHDDHEHEPRWW